jgi:hypothetical protein
MADKQRLQEQFDAEQADFVGGPGEAILMAITGRDGVIDELSGPGVQELTSCGADQKSKVSARPTE